MAKYKGKKYKPWKDKNNNTNNKKKYQYYDRKPRPLIRNDNQVEAETMLPWTKIKLQFELRRADKNSVKYILPGVAFTRKKKICFSVVIAVWNVRIMFRLIFDLQKATTKFSWRKWMS